MTDGVKLTGDQVVAMYPASVARGTAAHWPAVAMQWIQQADIEISRLAAENAALRNDAERTDLQLSRVLHEMAGSVSLCWEPKPTGVFESSKACEFVAAAISELRAMKWNP
jgi:hypothetical protein